MESYPPEIRFIQVVRYTARAINSILSEILPNWFRPARVEGVLCERCSDPLDHVHRLVSKKPWTCLGMTTKLEIKNFETNRVAFLSLFSW